MKFLREEQEYSVYEEKAREVWIRRFYGHTGFLKRAIGETEGVVLLGQDSLANQAGSSNPAVSAIFLNGPSKEKEAVVLQRYKTFYAQSRTGEKKTIVPNVRAVKKQVERVFLVTIHTKELEKIHPAYQGKVYPVWTFQGVGMTRVEAKDAYEARYNQEHKHEQMPGEARPLGAAIAFVKVSEEKM